MNTLAGNARVGVINRLRRTQTRQTFLNAANGIVGLRNVTTYFLRNHCHNPRVRKLQTSIKRTRHTPHDYHCAYVQLCRKPLKILTVVGKINKLRRVALILHNVDFEPRSAASVHRYNVNRLDLRVKHHFFADTDIAKTRDFQRICDPKRVVSKRVFYSGDAERFQR